MKKNKNPLNCIVNNFYNKNQFTIQIDVKDKRYIYFQSYKSEIAYINITDDILYINDKYIDYSKTTSKHLYLFIRDYTRYQVNNINDLQKLIKQGTIRTYTR